MTYKPPNSGYPATLAVKIELRSDDAIFLLSVLERARDGAEPYHQQCIDQLSDAIKGAPHE